MLYFFARQGKMQNFPGILVKHFIKNVNYLQFLELGIVKISLRKGNFLGMRWPNSTFLHACSLFPALSMEQDIPDYNMDAEDEVWVKKQAKTFEITPLKFEVMMDRLEKGSGQQVSIGYNILCVPFLKTINLFTSSGTKWHGHHIKQFLDAMDMCRWLLVRAWKNKNTEFWKEIFYNRSNVKNTHLRIEIFRPLSEILFTHTGSEIYLTSCFIACRVNKISDRGRNISSEYFSHWIYYRNSLFQSSYYDPDESIPNYCVKSFDGSTFVSMIGCKISVQVPDCSVLILYFFIQIKYRAVLTCNPLMEFNIKIPFCTYIFE